jgi:epoxyqueuosine reductase QueG
VIKESIIEVVEDMVTNAETETNYRQPLLGFADAKDDDFEKLKEIIAPEYKLPTDILSDAKTVISFFIPFAKEVVKANAQHEKCAPEWAISVLIGC